MRSPKGFGKNYFTLAAIQATVSQETMQSQCSAMQASYHVSHYDEEDLEEEHEQELFLSLIQESSKASHCSCFCSALSRQTIKNQSFQNYDIPQFLRTNSVSSPPTLTAS